MGGLVGAVLSVEGTGRLVTGTRNDESGALLPSQPFTPSLPVDNRLTVHTIRDTVGGILGLKGGGGRAGMEDDSDQDGGRAGAGVGWEPTTEAWMAHEGAVTGMALVKGYDNGRGDASALLTTGGDGCLRLFELVLDDNDLDNELDNDLDSGAGTTLTLIAQVDTHGEERATSVSATRRQAVAVGEDGCACLVDLERLASGGGGGGGGGGVVWRGQAKGRLPLSGVAFHGEGGEMFATAGCDPRGQLMLWDSRQSPAAGVPAAIFGCFRGSVAPYLCVAGQPFSPDVFACGVSTGELLLWDIRAGEVLQKLQLQDREGTGGGIWGMAFHPRSPRHLFSGSGSGVLTKWLLPSDGDAAANELYNRGGGYRFGATPAAANSSSSSWDWVGGRRLHSLPSRSTFAGVCYDEAADTVSAVSKHGSVVVAQGVPGLRL